jgi:hypothetical protein
VIGSVASTLTVPISVAALGIVFRGLAYALQSATEAPRERRIIDTTFAVWSILNRVGHAARGVSGQGHDHVASALVGDEEPEWGEFLGDADDLVGRRVGGGELREASGRI